MGACRLLPTLAGRARPIVTRVVSTALGKGKENVPMPDELRSDETLQVPVLIVGGSLVGLSMSLFLSWRGIASLVVERHPALARLPRARAINPRAMELFRMLGLEET